MGDARFRFAVPTPTCTSLRILLATCALRYHNIKIPRAYRPFLSRAFFRVAAANVVFPRLPLRINRNTNFTDMLSVALLSLSLNSSVFKYLLFFVFSSKTTATSLYAERTSATSYARPQAIIVNIPNEDVFKKYEVHFN